MIDSDLKDALYHNLDIFADDELKSLVRLVLDGNFGNGSERIDSLENAGYNYVTVQAAVDLLYQYTKKGIKIHERYHLYLR